MKVRTTVWVDRRVTRSRGVLRVRSTAAFVAAVVLALGACATSASDQPKQQPSTAPVDIERSGVRVTAPVGSVPDGVEVEVVRQRIPNPLSAAGVGGVQSLSRQAARITIDGGRLQPTAPLTIAIQVPEGNASANSLPVGFVLLSEDGALDYVRGRFDPSASAVVAEISHLSWVWPVRFDAGKTVDDAMTALVEATGLETSRPDCVDKSAVVSGESFTVLQPAQAWVCLEAGSGRTLQVDIIANSPVPFKIAANPSPARSQPITDLGDQSVAGAALLRGLRLVDPSEGVIGPGINSRFVFHRPVSSSLSFRSEPGLLVVQILVATLEPVLDSKRLETLGKLECFHGLVDAAQGRRLTLSKAGEITRAFLSCAGELADLTPVGSVLLALLSSAPQAFAGSVLGVVMGFTGEASFAVAIDAQRSGSGGDIIMGPGTAGSYSIGMTGAQAEALGLVRPTEGFCGRWEDVPTSDGTRQWTDFRRDDPDVLDNVFFARSDDGTAPRVVTDRGIRVGSSLAEVEAAYGRNLPKELFYPEGDPYIGVIVFGDRGAMIFGFEVTGPSSALPHIRRSARVETMQIASGRSVEELAYFVGGC